MLIALNVWNARSLTETVADHKGVKILKMYILNFLNILTSVQVITDQVIFSISWLVDKVSICSMKGWW